MRVIKELDTPGNFGVIITFCFFISYSVGPLGTFKTLGIDRFNANNKKKLCPTLPPSTGTREALEQDQENRGREDNKLRQAEVQKP